MLPDTVSIELLIAAQQLKSTQQLDTEASAATSAWMLEKSIPGPLSFKTIQEIIYPEWVKAYDKAVCKELGVRI